MKKKAIYAGTFDPITLGHLDIIIRSLKLFDHLIIGVGISKHKNPSFSIEERIECINQSLIEVLPEALDKISVKPIEGLLVDFLQTEATNLVIKGIRAISDFEYEFQMFSANQKLHSNIETIFLPASEKHHFISSRFIKEIASLGGDISSMTTKYVTNFLHDKLKNTQ